MATTIPTTMEKQKGEKSSSGKSKKMANAQKHYFREMDKELDGFLRRLNRQRKLNDKQMALPGFEEMF